MIRRNRHIFQILKDAEKPEVEIAEKRAFVRQAHGVINFAATRSFSSQPGASSFAGLNFALAQVLNSNLEVVVAGQTGIGNLSPQRLETQASVLAGDNHQFTFSAGYGHLPTFDRVTSGSNDGSLKEYSFRATDRWHIAGPVVVLYGFDYTRFEGGGAQANRINPRFNIDLQLSGNDQLFGAIYSPTGADIESSEEFETARIDFHGPVELINFNNQILVDRSRRFELGYIHTFKDRSRLEAALFLDNMVNHAVGMLSVPVEAEENSSEIGTKDSATPVIEHRGSARGLRVIYTRPLTKNISDSVGYSFGEGQQLDFSNDGQPNFSVGYFHVLSGKLDAQIVPTGTRISAVVRLATPQAIFAIDPFQQRLGTLDPNISIYIAQALPMFNFVPGHWEANLDARNLLDTSSGDDRIRLAIGQYWRSIRGGFSVRF